MITQINLLYKSYLFINMIISVRFINNQTYQKYFYLKFKIYL